MTTYYVDPENGNDAAAGLNWASAWKTLLNGATPARVGNLSNDEIRIAKSPDPVSIGSAAWDSGANGITYTTSNGVVDQCESGWSAGLVTPTYTTSYFRQGTASVQAVMTSTNGRVCYKTITSADFSTHSRITLWVNFGTAVNYTAGCPVQVRLCSDTAGNTAVNTFTLPAYYYPANTWVPITIDNGAGLGSAIQSVALYTTSAVSNTIRLDNITVAKEASDGTSLVLTDFIAKDNGLGEYYPIINISPTVVYFTVNTAVNFTGATATYTPSTGGDGAYWPLNGSETTNTLKRWGFSTALVVPAIATTTVIGQINFNYIATYPATKAYIGGVNPVTDVVDGETWFDGVTGYGYGISQSGSTQTCYSVSNIGAARYNTNYTVGEGPFVNVDNCSSVDARAVIITTSSSTMLPTWVSSTFSFKWISQTTATGAAISYTGTGGFGLKPGGIRTITLANGRVINAQFFVGLATPVTLNITGTLTVATGSSASIVTTSDNTIININNLISTRNQTSVQMFSCANISDVATQVNVTGILGLPSAYTGAATVIVATNPQQNISINGAGATIRTPTSGGELRVINNATAVSMGWIHINDFAHDQPAKFKITAAGPAFVAPGYISFSNYNNTAGDHRIYLTPGVSGVYAINYLQYQTAFSRSGNGAWKYIMAGDNANICGAFPIGTVATNGGSQVTVSLWVYVTDARGKAALEVVGRQTRATAVSTTTGGWEQLTVNITPTNNTMLDVRAVVSLGTPASVNAYTMYFDDLTVTQA